MMHTMRSMLLKTALGGFCFLLLQACSGDNPANVGGGGNRPGGNANNTPAVEVVQARYGSLPLEERITGRVTARNQTEIYPEVAGTIIEIFVENGDEVEAGDPLLRLRDSEFNERYQQALSGWEIARAQTQQARANLSLVQSNFERTESLVSRNLENNVSLETARSELSIAEADLQLRLAQEKQAQSLADERRIQLENATIRAPVSGTVGQRNAEVGQLASSSTRLFTVGELTRMRVEVLLTDRMLEHISVGVPANIFSNGWGDKVLNSTISRISPFLDTNTMRTQAYVELENEQSLLRPGMFVTVDILYGESEQAVLIPNSALYRHPRTGIEGVYVVSREEGANGNAVETSQPEDTGIIANPRPVTFVPIEIIASGRMATAVSGIEDGDMVVTVGQNMIQGSAEAVKPRLLPWDHMMNLQSLQNEDIFEVIEQKRQTLQDKS